MRMRVEGLKEGGVRGTQAEWSSQDDILGKRGPPLNQDLRT